MRKKFKDFYHKHVPSIKLPLIILAVLFFMIPLYLQGRLLASSSRQAQIESRMIDVQNQCQILSNKMSRSGYLSNNVLDNGGIDAELSTLADIFKGRIIIVNSGFRIVKDTFALSDGKICISEEVIRCFQGEITNKYNTVKHYFLLAVPIFENPPVSDVNGTTPLKTNGVMLVTASTDGMYELEELLQSKAAFYQLVSFVVVLICIILVINMMMKPFRKLVQSVDRVADGNIDEVISVHTFKETRQISRSINTALIRLRALEKSRQEFVSNVSHELKTPITSIRVLADSLMGMEDAPKELYQEFMNDISEEIDRESKIIDDLLSLVRMDKTRAELKVQQTNINDLAGVILKRLRPIAKKRNIELIFESKREVMADVDEVKFSLAVNNLVENAVKYNVEDGWVRVTLDADHKFFYLKVSDSGIGIPEDLKDRVFDRFFRVDKARSRETGGTGLGLAITKSVVLMHRGAIRVNSEENVGTTFIVRIPLNYVP